MDIPQLTTAVWQLIQPYLPLLAAKGVEELGKRAVGEVWEAVKGRFAQKDETKKLTDKLLAEPGNPAVQGAFQYHLQELLEADADFARALAALVEAAGRQYQAVVHGGGAVAQGPGAKAVGEGGTLVEGGVGGDLVTGVKITLGQPGPDPAVLRRAYLERLRRHCQSLPLGPLGGEEGTDEEVSLDEVYIDLDTTRPIRKKDLETLRSGKPKELPSELPERDFERLERGETTFLPVFEAVRFTPRLVLLGDAGAGKSTFVRKLLGWQAAAWLGECQPPPGFDGDLLPILIILRELAIPLENLSLERLSAEERKRHLLEAVRQHLNNPLVNQALETGKVLLALDGLDEVPQDLRQTVRQAVAALLSEYRIERLLITCRVRSYSGQAVFEHLPVFTLRPFDKEKIGRFVRAWYHTQTEMGRIRPADRDERIRDLTWAATSADLLEIASNPMMLTSMAIIHQKEIGLPKERVRLYKLVVDVLLRRWQKYKVGEGQMAPSKALLAFLKDENLLLNAMERLAYEAHQAGKGRKETADLPRLRALEILEGREYLGEIGLAQEFLDYVDQRAGLLKGNGGELEKPTSYSFPHRTFQEYLAGCYLIRERAVARQYRLHAAEGDFWMLAALLGAEELYFNRRSPHAMRDLAYELLPDAMPATAEEQRLALWSGLIACVAGKEEIAADEGGVVKGSVYLERARQALLQTLQGALPPLERAEAGRLLAKLGDPRPEALTCEQMAFCHVPAGEFVYGEGKEQKKMTLPEYWMGKYPVTNAQFAQFVAAGGYDNPDYWREAQKEGYWSSEGFKGGLDNAPRKAPMDFGEPFNLGNHPMVGVSWYEVLAFTRWLTAQLAANSEQLSVNQEGERLRKGLRSGSLRVALPTEEQWEKAARGADGREYPWEGEFDPNKANTVETGIGSTTAVGCFPGGASPYGCLDMSGNVLEWTAEAGPLRGGSFDGSAVIARCACRSWYYPDYGLRDFGFRVVVSPREAPPKRPQGA